MSFSRSCCIKNPSYTIAFSSAIILQSSNFLLPCFYSFSALPRLLTAVVSLKRGPSAPPLLSHSSPSRVFVCLFFKLTTKCIYFGSGCVWNWLISPSDGLFIKLLLSCCVEGLCPRSSPSPVVPGSFCPELKFPLRIM